MVCCICAIQASNDLGTVEDVTDPGTAESTTEAGTTTNLGIAENLTDHATVNNVNVNNPRSTDVCDSALSSKSFYGKRKTRQLNA